MNRICFIGNIGKEPELKKTQSGKSVMSIDIACKRDRKDGDEYITDWITTVIWQGAAEYVARNAHKGDVVAVEGRLQSRKWQDKDGHNRINWEVQADNVSLIRRRSEDNKTVEYSNFEEVDESDGNLPF